MTCVIAVSNQKGGVAKTTTTLSLGACLAELGKSVLLIDMDPQSHLTLSIGLNPANMHRTISDVLLANASMVSASRESPVFALDIVPANQELALIDKLLYGRNGYEYRLKKRLAAMDTDFYDVVLIDCPPYFGTLTLNALTAANQLIIPAQCEFYAAHSLRQILELAKLVREKTNPELNYQILVTMYDRRNRICRLVLDQMQLELKPLLFETIIEVDTKLRESPAFGQPITLYAPNTRGAQQYRELAKELIHHD
jgi:chromosome partitioning protein